MCVVKCSQLEFGKVPHVKLLGVVIDSNLNYFYMYKNCGRKLTAMSRLSRLFFQTKNVNKIMCLHCCNYFYMYMCVFVVTIFIFINKRWV